MAVQLKGMSVPVGVNKAGGAKLNPKTTHFSQTLALAFSEGDDKNPFQDLGINSDLVFQVNNVNAQAKVRRRVEQIANKFVGQISLDPIQPIIFSHTKEGELEMTVNYIDLATDTEESFTNTFSGSVTGG